VVLCRQLNLFTEAVVAIDGSTFKAVNNRDKNFTPYKVERRMEQIEAGIDRYMAAMDATDRQEGEVAQAKSARLKDKIASLKRQMQQFLEMQRAVQAAPDQQISLTDPDARSMATRHRDRRLQCADGCRYQASPHWCRLPSKPRFCLRALEQR
jgi:formylmethanofuran:tetrahydromethanopterin formyltransferase